MKQPVLGAHPAAAVQQPRQKRYLLHLEILRILAIFGVIFAHTGDVGYSLFMQYTPGTWQYHLYLLMSVSIRWSLPVFFLISGALLLGRQDSLHKIFTKRMPKIIVCLVVFSLVAYLQDIHLGTETGFHFGHFVHQLISDNWLGPYWYLYAYLAFLLTLPFMQAMVARLPRQMYVYLIVIAVILGDVVPILPAFFPEAGATVNEYFSIAWLLGYYPLYPLVGYYLERKVDIHRVTVPRLLELWALNLCCILVTMKAVSLDCIRQGGFSQTYIRSFTVIMCICMFLTWKKICVAVAERQAEPAYGRFARFLIAVGKTTFGVYLLHGLLMREPEINLWIWLSIHAPGMDYMSKTLIWCLENLVLASLMTWVFQKVTGLIKTRGHRRKG